MSCAVFCVGWEIRARRSISLACVLNIVLDFILVGACGMRAAGAAAATVTAQGASFATALGFLYRKGFHFEFTRRDIRPVRAL